MNHFNISIVKSLVRILSCMGAFIGAFYNILVAVCIISAGMLTAEVLGILEEVFDKRKE